MHWEQGHFDKTIHAMRGKLMQESLFREQVLKEQTDKYFGPVLLQTPLSVRTMVLTLAGLLLTGSVFLMFGQYSRREKVSGILIPDSGLIKIFPPRAGVVSAVMAKEGDSVEENRPIISMGTGRHSGSGAEVNSLKIQEIKRLIAATEEHISSLPERKLRESVALQREASQISQRIEHYKAQQKLGKERLKIKELRHQRISALAEEKIISADDFQQNTDSILQARNAIQESSNSILLAEAEKSSITYKLENLDASYIDQQNTVQIQLSEQRQKLAELDVEQSQMILAPIQGKITAIQAFRGMNVDPQKPLAVLVPHGSKLEAHLYAPSRAIGFIRKGQKVLLQYAAFPYQKYGVHSATIIDVSHSVLNPSEIEEMDLSSVQEPLYRITAQLEKETIHAFQQEIPLQTGMLLKADIILDQRSFIEWLLEPLYRVKG